MKSSKRAIFPIILAFFLFEGAFATHASTKILGVMQTDEGERGIVADLSVEVLNGTGRVFIMTMPLTEIDTQASARLSQEVACDILNIDCHNHDFFYSISSDYPIVGGPSAGAAMTITTLAALLDKKIYTDVMVTGTVNPDGSIGPVGGILPKVEAAYKEGASEVLIPDGQSIFFIEQTSVSQIGSITQTTTTINPVNVATYAKSNWNVDVKEMQTISDAFTEMTGFEIVRESHSTTIPSSDYIRISKQMSEMFLGYSRELFENASQSLKESGLSYNNYQEVENIIAEASSFLDKAEQYETSYNYYSSASYCVRSAIESNYASKLVDYYSGNYATKNNIKQEIDSNIENLNYEMDKIIMDKEINHIYDIELISVSIDRFREAQNFLEEAYRSYYSTDYRDALYYNAFAEIRVMTAENWASIMDSFAGEFNTTFNLIKFKELSQRRLEEARMAVIYASTVTSGGFLVSAQNQLDTAELAHEEGKYVFSIFESLKAISESNLAMEIRGLDVSELTQKAKDKQTMSEAYIEDAKSEGLLPILAISYQEYAKAVEDIYQELIFLSYAKEFAKVSKDLIYALNSTSISQSGISVYIKNSTEGEANSINKYLFLLAGLLTGIILSLFKLEKFT